MGVAYLADAVEYLRSSMSWKRYDDFYTSIRIK
jgi:hypothetical protein